MSDSLEQYATAGVGAGSGLTSPNKKPPLTPSRALNPANMEGTPLTAGMEQKTIYDFQVLDCYHELYDLKQHRGHPLLIVNVASKCKEYTVPCYTLLNTLYKKYSGTGFTILGFPCNQFGASEPGLEDEIVDNMTSLYPNLDEIAFPIMAKVDVNGDRELSLFTYLKSCLKGTLGQSAIKWNFTYFLIDQAGVPVCRFSSDATIEDIEEKLDALLRGEVLEPTDAASPRLTGSAPAPAQTDATLAGAADALKNDSIGGDPLAATARGHSAS